MALCQYFPFFQIFAFAILPYFILICIYVNVYNNNLPDDVICNTAIDADDTTLYSKCAQTSDLWHHLKFTSALESDLQDTVDWG